MHKGLAALQVSLKQPCARELDSACMQQVPLGGCRRRGMEPAVGMLLPLKVPTKMPSPILFRKSPTGLAETAPTACLPWGAEPGRAVLACAGTGMGS